MIHTARTGLITTAALALTAATSVFAAPAEATGTAPTTTCGVRAIAAPPDAAGSPFGVTAGPGGTWYSDGQTIDVVHGARTTAHYVPDPADAYVGWLTRDGRRVWFADRGTGAIGTVTANGTIDEIKIPDGTNGAAVPQGIVVEHHIAVWFTDQANDRLGLFSTTTGNFSFFPVPSGNPLGLVRAGDGDLWFTERAVDKVARFDPTTDLFTEWTLPTGAFPNRLTVTPDGTVWFTSLLISAIWHVDSHGHLHEYPIDGGPVGITYWRGHLWAALYTAGQVAELSVDGRLEKTWTLPDSTTAGPLQIAGSRKAIWTTGSSAVYAINPDC